MMALADDIDLSGSELIFPIVIASQHQAMLTSLRKRRVDGAVSRQSLSLNTTFSVRVDCEMGADSFKTRKTYKALLPFVTDLSIKNFDWSALSLLVDYTILQSFTHRGSTNLDTTLSLFKGEKRDNLQGFLT